MNVHAITSLFFLVACFCSHASEPIFSGLNGVDKNEPLFSTAVSENQWLYIGRASSNSAYSANGFFDFDKSTLDVSAGSHWILSDTSAFTMNIGWRGISATYPDAYDSSASSIVAGSVSRSSFAPAMELFDGVGRAFLEFEESDDHLHGEWLRIGTRYLVTKKISFSVEVGRLKRYFEDSKALRIDAVTMAFQYNY